MRHIVVILGALAVLFAADAFYRATPMGAGTGAGTGAGPLIAAAAAQSPQSKAPPAVPVEVAKVKTGTVVDEAGAIGTLVSNESVIVRPEVAGRITQIHFREGQRVEEGSLLFNLDDSVPRADLADANARLQLGRRNYERAKELFARKAGTGRARDEAQSQLETARAAVQVAKARLEKMQIHAPFSGVIGLRKVSVGDYVTAGQDLVNLENISPIKVDFSIPERYLSALSTGLAVVVNADAFSDRSFEGEVYAIDPKIDPEARSIHVRALVDNADRLLRPGLFVRVKLQLSRRENAIIVPEEAIVPRGQDRFVFTVVDGTARMTKVTLGQRRYGEVEIVSGLDRDAEVVVAGQLKIRDGAPVKPIREGAETAATAEGGKR
jgi:membrane fusion protein (multidrug efflux system)